MSFKDSLHYVPQVKFSVFTNPQLIPTDYCLYCYYIVYDLIFLFDFSLAGIVVIVIINGRKRSPFVCFFM